MPEGKSAARQDRSTVDRPVSSDPAPFENDVASTDLVFRASAFFERQDRQANRSFPRSSLAPIWTSVSAHAPTATAVASPSLLASIVSNIQRAQPECSIAKISPFLSASSFPFRPFDINKRRAASTASPPEARSPRERVKDAERQKAQLNVTRRPDWKHRSQCGSNDSTLPARPSFADFFVRLFGSALQLQESLATRKTFGRPASLAIVVFRNGWRAGRQHDPRLFR